MKHFQLSSLYDYKVKKIGILFGVIFAAFEIIIRLTGIGVAFDIRFIQYLGFVSILSAVFSKEVHDDERSLIIRYFSLKQTALVLMFALVVIDLLNLHVRVVHTITASLYVYLLIFRIVNHFNPDFLYREETSESNPIFKILVGIMFVVVVILLINVIYLLWTRS